MKTYVVIICEQVAYAIDVQSHDNEVIKLKGNKLYLDYLFVTPTPNDLVTFLPVGEGCMADILDFECLDKEIRQSITYVDTKNWKWSLPEMIQFYLSKELEWSEDNINEILESMKECFLTMKERGASEWKRIMEIELPINRLLYKTQRQGVYVNNEAVKVECEKCYSDIYNLKNIIQIKLRQTIPDYKEYMLDIDTPEWVLNHYKRKILARHHPEIEYYIDLEKKERNFRSLMYMSSFAENQKCKPLFKGFGSSTGRIIMKEPSLQNLNRKYRNFIKDPEVDGERKRYVYVDYGQFEAGILAGLIDNEKLIKLYNEGDIYETLGSAVKVDRDMAKSYFYYFVYGGRFADGSETFFNKYCSKEEIDVMIEKYKLEDKVIFLFGNARILDSNGENNWLVNHLIQSVSSLIFKKALLGIETINSGNIELVVPMHDAALYMVSSMIDDEQIKRVFINAFKEYFPKINPIVNLKDYFKGE